jgi:hypothetical protein
VLRFFPWYVAAVLAAYAASTSWSLGRAGEEVAAEQQQVQELSAQLDEARHQMIAFDQHGRCAANCPYTD